MEAVVCPHGHDADVCVWCLSQIHEHARAMLESVAKYDCLCPACGTAIYVGQPVVRDDVFWCHVRCA